MANTTVSAPVAKKHNFGQILTFLGVPVPTPSTDEGQIWWVGADPWSTLTRQISSECVHCVGFRWPKTTIWANFDIFDIFLPMRAKFGVP